MTAPLQTYEQALEYLYGRINYERVHATAYRVSDFKLTRMRRLLELLGNPQEKIPAVHIAGTKGKGSTAAMIASVLVEAGYRTGLFTSPHITSFEERMTVNGCQPAPDDVVDLVNALIEAVSLLDQSPGEMNPTYFEITTAMAWLWFMRQRAEIVVLEVGLGGRLDATNLCRPVACLITNISRDHTQLLGFELDEIAREKAGIAKTGVPLISGVRDPLARKTVEECCAEQGAPLIQWGIDFVWTDSWEMTSDSAKSDSPDAGDPDHVPPVDAVPNIQGKPDLISSMNTATITWGARSWSKIPIPLPGRHQVHNTSLAVIAIDHLRQAGWKVSEPALLEGLRKLKWPARIEVLRREPTVIVDAAHNWASIRALLDTLDESFPSRNRVLIFAATRDKDVLGMLRLLVPRFETVILTCYLNNPRTLTPENLLQMMRTFSNRHVHLAMEPAAAWKLAVRFAQPSDLICVTGSFFIAAELRELILDVWPEQVSAASKR